jgi:DNA-binding transcriptional MocR family regulator
VNAGPTSERVYDSLRRAIISGAYRPGSRLDPAVLADELNSSATPVRGALYRLTGENLVETATSEGFHLPQIDAPGLQDLYDWSNDVLMLAIRSWSKIRQPEPASTRQQPNRSAADLFLAIARRSPNIEHARTVGSLNDRLGPIRLVEHQVLGDARSESGALDRAEAVGDRTQLRRLLSGYHRRRRTHAAEIVRALYRAAEEGP